MRLLFLLLLISSSARTQPLTQNQKLASLCKIWGFLKYYHPAVATGKQDWDGKLIELIPAVQQAGDRDQLSAVYAALLDELGTVERCRKCEPEATVSASNRRNFDLSFLTDSMTVNNSLLDRLKYLKDNRAQGNNVYVQQVKQIGNTSYENEKLYADMPTPDESYRLLALFRYWNIIHYFFPYKYAVDGNWNDALTDMIPVFQAATTEQAYQNALYQLVARIQDSHGFMMNIDKSRCLRCDLGTLWLPFDVHLINGIAIITRFYNDALNVSRSLAVGSVISHIDGEPVQARIDRLKPYISASNNGDLLRDVKGLLGVGTAKEATLRVQHNNRDTTITVIRYPYLKLGKAALTSINAQVKRI